MKHHVITVTFKSPPPFTYVDQNGKSTPNHHVDSGDDISWRSPDGSLAITFPNGCDPTNGHPPASVPKDTATVPVMLHGKKGDQCKYDVTINSTTDDPMIIFDSGLFDGNTGLEAADLKIIASSAQDALGEIVTKMSGVASVKADPQRLFFPQGINLVSVDVEFGTAKVIIKVAGPGVS